MIFLLIGLRKAYKPEGLEGEVMSVIEDIHLTANRPILVKLTKAK